jgi:hypothetical protein
MAKTPTPDAIDKAMEILSVHWDNVLILANRYDPTAKATVFAWETEGNDFAIDRQAEEWVKCGGTDQLMMCPSCVAGHRGDDAAEGPVEDDDPGDSIGNRM